MKLEEWLKVRDCGYEPSPGPRVVASDRAMTLEEIAKAFGVTRERIREIEASALNKLRHPARIKPLAPFTERCRDPWDNIARSAKKKSLEQLDWAPNFWAKVV